MLSLERKVYTERSTTGRLFIDGDFECYTLEDPVRPKKIRGITAIPEGTFEIAITHSNKFKQFMPLLLGVPNFAGIRIHWGNRPEHTEGCILVGKSVGDDMIGTSKLAYDGLNRKLARLVKRGKVYIQVSGGGEMDVAAAEDLDTIAA